MKFKNSLFYTFNVILLIAIIFTISTSYNSTDYSYNLIKFIKYEDARNLNEILDSYVFPVKKYWNQENLGKNELEKAYNKAWKNVQDSRNEIIEIKKINNFKFILTTLFKYKLNDKNKESTVLSKLEFKLNNDGKIVSIENISNAKLASSITNELRGIETKEYQTINLFIKKYKYSLIIFLLIIVLNTWWIISIRYLAIKLKSIELKEKKKLENVEQEKERLEYLIEKKRLRLANVEEVKGGERLEELIEKRRLAKEKERLDLIEKRRLAKVEQENEKRRLAKEKERLVLIEKRRLAKVEQENEKRRLVKEKERLVLIEKRRLAKVEQENEKKRQLALVEKASIEKVEKNKTNQSQTIDLTKYMGPIDEAIMEDEKSEKNKTKLSQTIDLNKWMGKID